MSDLLAVEDWPSSPTSPAPQAIMYLCGPLRHVPTPTDISNYVQTRHLQVLHIARTWVQSHTAVCLPKSASAHNPSGLDVRWLHATDHPDDPMLDQWLRPNIDPSERYVLSVAGSSAFRLRAGQSGFSNLVLAGDWAWTPLNAGCVEATTHGRARRRPGHQRRSDSHHGLAGPPAAGTRSLVVSASVTAQKRKVAVLGGGAGSMAALWALTSLPNASDRFDITVYQMGWRLGGKGASGRNAAFGHRIEEHGLHVWGGFYRNAFRMMREIYAAQPADGRLFKQWSDAFKRHSNVLLEEHVDGRWMQWPIALAEDPLDGPDSDPTRAASCRHLASITPARLILDALDPPSPPNSHRPRSRTRRRRTRGRGRRVAAAPRDRFGQGAASSFADPQIGRPAHRRGRRQRRTTSCRVHRRPRTGRTMPHGPNTRTYTWRSSPWSATGSPWPIRRPACRQPCRGATAARADPRSPAPPSSA